MTDHAESRYQRDPEFKQLVDMLHGMVCKAQFSPTELREAAMLAHIHYALTDARPFVLKTCDGTIDEFTRFVRDGYIGRR